MKENMQYEQKWVWQLKFLIVMTCHTGVSYYTVGDIYVHQ